MQYIAKEDVDSDKEDTFLIYTTHPIATLGRLCSSDT